MTSSKLSEKKVQSKNMDEFEIYLKNQCMKTTLTALRLSLSLGIKRC